MKKKNLLTLGALVLSLGLTVTSCAGAKGEDGAPGKDGTNGTNGVDGKDGKDGKTYIAVINLDRIADVNVTQSAYFVEPGEKVTFTFTPETSSKKADVLVDLEINGEAISEILEADDNGVITYTIDTTNLKGIQLTGGTYTKVSEYGASLVEDHLDELQEGDALLLGTVSAASTKDAVSDYESKDFVKNQYASAKSEIAKVYTANKDKTTAEKIAAVKESAATQNAAIDTAYKTLVDNTKTTAKAAAKVLNNSVSTSEYKDADKETILASVNSEIDAATTLEGISKVINSVSKKEGTFNNLISAKTNGFALVSASLNAVTTKETALNGASTSASALKSLKESLAAWGVEVSTLPSEIAKEANEEISKATSLTMSTVTGYTSYPEVAVSAATKIQGAIDDVKDALVKAIKESYFKEIEESSALEANSKVTVKAYVEQAVKDFVYSDVAIKDLTSSNSSSYISLARYAAQGTTVSTANDTLVGAIENKLSETLGSNQAFQAERINKKIASAVALFESKVKELKDADSDLAKVNAGFVNIGTASTPNYVFKTVEKLGNTGYQLDNPYLANEKSVTSYIPTGATKASFVYYASDAMLSSNDSTLTALKQVEDASTAETSVTLNLDKRLFDLESACSTGGSAVEFLDSVEDVLTWQEAHKGDFEAIYKVMKSTYVTAAKGKAFVNAAAVSNSTTSLKGQWVASDGTAISNAADTDVLVTDETVSGTGADTKYAVKSTTKFITRKEAESNWKDDNTKTLLAISSLYEGTVKSTDALKAVDSGLVAWIGTSTTDTSSNVTNTKMWNDDKAYLTYVGLALTDATGNSGTGSISGSLSNTSSVLVKGFNDEVKGILAGTVSATDAAQWAKETNLNLLYESDVTEYLSDTKELFAQAYQVQFNSHSDSVTYLQKLRAMYDACLAVLGHKVKVDSTAVAGVKIDDSTGTTDYGTSKVSTINAWFTWASDKLTKVAA